MGAAAVVSRGFGAVRVLVIGAVLGTTYLGNAFQGANQFSTVLFELLAAGALSAVLVPTFVALLDAGGDARAEEIAGGVLGAALLVLGGVTIVGVVFAPALADLLTTNVDDPAIRAEQAELTATLLRFFVPQLLLYALGAVATAVLNAKRIFAIPAAAPIANTVVMVAFLALFRATAGPDPGLSLSTGEQLLLAAAGTLGVAAFVAVPAIALRRAGFRLRPRLRLHDEGVRRVVGLGTWATVQHAAAGLLLGAAIVVGGGVEGAVVAFQIGWFFFLAPYGVIAQPIQTTVLPELVGQVGEDRGPFAASLRWSLETTGALLLPVTAVFVVLARPMAEVLAFGEARSGAGVALIAAAVASLGTGIFAYGAYLLLARAYYALGDSRTPGIVSIAAAGLGVLGMVLTGAGAEGTGLVVVMGLAHTFAFALAAILLGALLARRERVHVWTPRLAVPVVLAAGAGGLAWLALQAWAPTGRIEELAALVALGGAIGAVCLLATRQLGLLGPRPGETIEAAA
jgi:putative peptidoglycan lipid II flippase